MKKMIFSCFRTLMFLLWGIMVATAQNTVEQQVTFSTQGQNWFQSGYFPVGIKDYLLDGAVRTFESFDVGDSDFISLTGKFGFDFDVYYNIPPRIGGEVDINFPIKMRFDYPTDRSYGCGEEIPITTSYTIQPGYAITSTPPAFEIQCGVMAKGGAYAGVDSYFGGGEAFDLGNPNFEDATEDNYVDRMEGGEANFFGMRSLNGMYLPFPADLPYTIPAGLAQSTKLSGTVDVPFTTNPADVITGNVIRETASKQFLDLSFNPTQFILDRLFLQLTYENGISGVGEAGYSLFEVPFNFTSTLEHELEFKPEVYVRMVLDRSYNYRVRDENGQIVDSGAGSEVRMQAGHTLLVTVPDDNQPISVTPYYQLENEFTVEINNNFDLDLEVNALSAYARSESIEICDPTGIADAFGADDCFTIGPYGVDVGPLFHESFDLYDVEHEYYPSRTRALNGFQQNIPGQPFTLRPDNTPPAVTTRNITVYIPDAGGAVGITPQDVIQSAGDAHGGVLRTSVSPNSFDCANLGANTVVLSADDSRCNETTREAVVTVVDRTRPDVTCKPVTVYLDDNGATGVAAADVFDAGWDNCGQVNPVSVSPNAFSCNQIGANTVTLRVNDGHGNENTCSAVVTVVDDKAPVLVCKTKNVYLNAAGQASIVLADVVQTATDNCGTVNLSLSRSQFTCDDFGAVEVTVSANDGRGNHSSCIATVQVLDPIAPTVSCKEKVEAILDAAGRASITPEDVFLSGADNCNIVNLQSVVPSQFNCGNIGNNVVTLTVNDGHGNTATCTVSTLGIHDHTLPVMQCRNVTLNLDANGSASLSVAQVNNGSYDNCNIREYELSRTNFTCEQPGEHTVVLTGRDQSLNESSCTAIVTVRDQIAPTARCKNAVASLGANGSLLLPASAVNDGSSDNCSVDLSVTPNAFNCSNVGTQTVTLRATDGSGNTSVCTAVVTLRDAVAPVALCKNATVYLDDEGRGVLDVAAVNNSSTDACGIATMSLNKTEFNCSEIEGSPWNVVMTVKDIHNNQSTCLASVTIVDADAPTAICENLVVNLGADGTATVYGEELALNSFDNCSVWSYAPVAKVFTRAGVYELPVQVSDWSGNTAACVATVQVLPAVNGRSEEKPAMEKNVVLYPNPTGGEANLRFTLETEQAYRLLAFDPSGRLVLQRDGMAVPGENVLPFSLSGLASGMYWVELTCGSIRLRRQLMVQGK